MQSTLVPSAVARAGTFRGRPYWQILTRTAPIAAGLHAGLALLIELLGGPQYAIGNVVIVALWGIVWWLLRERHNRLAVLLMWVAIPGHALLATVTLGWDSGFHYYLVAMVPVLFVSPGRGAAVRLSLTALIGGFYIALDLFGRQHVPTSPIDPAAMAWVRSFNIAALFGILAWLAHTYFGVVGQAEAQLRALATTDVLTGLSNRRRILDVAQYEIQRGRRDGTPLSFILGDVDDFKRINDTHGHETGDQVLVAMARALRQAVRQADTVARWGGEEFLVVLPETELDAALGVAERAREGLSASAWPLERELTMTFGVSQWREGESLAEAVARADEALYRGKRAGRNRTVPEREAVQPNSLPSSPARR